MKNEDLQQNKELETLNYKSKWGGHRDGAGRPKGTKNPETLEKERVAEEMRLRIMRSADQLLNSQMNLAQGVQMLYCIEKDSEGKKKKPRIVTDQQEIEDYLAGELDGDDYYFITTERPDNRALDSLFDRVFGKAINNVDVKSDGEKITVNVINYGETTNNNEPDEDATKDESDSDTV